MDRKKLLAAITARFPQASSPATTAAPAGYGVELARIVGAYREHGYHIVSVVSPPARGDQPDPRQPLTWTLDSYRLIGGHIAPILTECLDQGEGLLVVARVDQWPVGPAALTMTAALHEEMKGWHSSEDEAHPLELPVGLPVAATTVASFRDPIMADIQDEILTGRGAPGAYLPTVTLADEYSGPQTYQWADQMMVSQADTVIHWTQGRFTPRWRSSVPDGATLINLADSVLRRHRPADRMSDEPGHFATIPTVDGVTAKQEDRFEGEPRKLTQRK